MGITNNRKAIRLQEIKLKSNPDITSTTEFKTICCQVIKKMKGKKALKKRVRVRKLKTPANIYEFYLLGHLSCKLLAPLSAIKLLSDRSREHVHRQANVNN